MVFGAGQLVPPYTESYQQWYPKLRKPECARHPTVLKGLTFRHLCCLTSRQLRCFGSHASADSRCVPAQLAPAAMGVSPSFLFQSLMHVLRVPRVSQQATSATLLLQVPGSLDPAEGDAVGARAATLAALPLQV